MRPAFEARAVFKRFGRAPVLENLELSVPEGSVTVILGRNGAGKTTLLRAAVGLVPLDRGSICVAGLDARREPIALRREVAFVPDTPDVYPWMTLAALFRFLRPHYCAWSDGEAARLAEAFDLPMDVPFESLSRGQATKGMLAAALAPRPSVLLLDEPFGGLDPIARDDVLKGVIGELRDESRTVICSTHDLGIASRLADHVAVLAGGAIRRFAGIEDLAETEQGGPAPEMLRSVFDSACSEALR